MQCIITCATYMQSQLSNVNPATRFLNSGYLSYGHPIFKGKKVKVAFWGLFNTAAVRPIVFSPQQVPAFISRGATHHTDARDLYQRRRELLPMNFPSKSVIHENPLSSFTCHKAGTWDIIFYFPSKGRHTEDFPDSRKIQQLRPGLKPRTRVPVASMLTTRPPKPSYLTLCFKVICTALVRLEVKVKKIFLLIIHDLSFTGILI